VWFWLGCLLLILSVIAPVLTNSPMFDERHDATVQATAFAITNFGFVLTFGFRKERPESELLPATRDR